MGADISLRAAIPGLVAQARGATLGPIAVVATEIAERSQRPVAATQKIRLRRGGKLGFRGGYGCPYRDDLAASCGEGSRGRARPVAGAGDDQDGRVTFTPVPGLGQPGDDLAGLEAVTAVWPASVPGRTASSAAVRQVRRGSGAAELVAGRAAAFLAGPHLDRQRGERPATATGNASQLRAPERAAGSWHQEQW